jgi:hypothetical protein
VELLQNREGQGVKKSVKQTCKPEPQPAVTELVEAKPMDKGALRDHISKLVCAGAVEMVTNTIAKVHDGQYQAMKYLFEMIGLFPSTAVPEASQEDSLAGTLLSRLGLPEDALSEVERGNPQGKTKIQAGNNVK